MADRELVNSTIDMLETTELKIQHQLYKKLDNLKRMEGVNEQEKALEEISRDFGRLDVMVKDVQHDIKRCPVAEQTSLYEKRRLLTETLKEFEEALRATRKEYKVDIENYRISKEIEGIEDLDNDMEAQKRIEQMDDNALHSRMRTAINQKLDSTQIKAKQREKADEELRELDEQAKIPGGKQWRHKMNFSGKHMYEYRRQRLYELELDPKCQHDREDCTGACCSFLCENFFKDWTTCPLILLTLGSLFFFIWCLAQPDLSLRLQSSL